MLEESTMNKKMAMILEGLQNIRVEEVTKSIITKSDVGLDGGSIPDEGKPESPVEDCLCEACKKKKKVGSLTEAEMCEGCKKKNKKKAVVEPVVEPEDAK